MKAKLVEKTVRLLFFALKPQHKCSENFAIRQFPLGFKRFKQLMLPSADNFTEKDKKPVQVALMQWPRTLGLRLS